MSITFSCAGCGSSYSVKDEFAGKKTRCKKCNALIEIPSTDTSLDPPDIGFMDDEPSRPAPMAGGSVASGGSGGSGRSIYSDPVPDAPPTVARMPLRSDAPSSYAEPGVSRVTTIHNARPGTAAATYAKSGMAARSTSAAAIARADDPSVNGMSVMLGTLFILGTTALGIYLHATAEQKVPWFFVPAFVLMVAGMFFLCIAGGTTLGSFVTYKIFGQVVPSKLYLRAVGVNLAAWVLMLVVAVAAFGVMYLLALAGAPRVLALFINLAVLVIQLVICFKMYTQFLDLTGLRTLVAMIFSGIFGAIFALPAIFVLTMLIALIAAADQQADQMLASNEPYKRPTQSVVESVGTPGGESANAAAVNPAASAAERARLVSEISNLKRRIADVDRLITPTAVRESMAADMEGLRNDIVTGETTYASISEFAEVKQAFAEMDKKFATLPSREPEAAIFDKASSGEVWDTPAPADFTPAMTVLGDLFVNVPRDARIDLSGDPASYAMWTSPDGKVTFSLFREPRNDAKQQQPWIILPQMSLIARQKQLMYIVSDERKSATGAIGDMIFTRGERTPTQTVPIAGIRYVSFDGDKWLVAEVSAEAKDEGWFRQFESAIRTLRPMKSGEETVSPFAPVFMVDRLADQPTIATDRLTKAGAAAEPALLKIASDDSHASRTRAIQILANIGTEESLPLFKSLVDAPDPLVSEAARKGVLRIDPKNASELDFAIGDLQSAYTEQTAYRHLNAMNVLAKTKPDDRRETVAPLLEQIVTTSTPEALVAPAAEALVMWQRPETVDALLPMLSDPASENAKGLDAALVVLGSSKQDRVVLPVLSWGGKRLDAVTRACKHLGEMAEDDLIKMLSMNPQAKAVACDVLKETGSARAIVMLERTSRDKNNAPELQAKARDAVSAIRNRAKK